MAVYFGKISAKPHSPPLRERCLRQETVRGLRLSGLAVGPVFKGRVQSPLVMASTRTRHSLFVFADGAPLLIVLHDPASLPFVFPDAGVAGDPGLERHGPRRRTEDLR